MDCRPLYAAMLLGVSALAGTAAAAEPPHNVVLLVADGLRGAMVDDQTAPNMAQLARQGVHLRNGHSLFPTFTTANASAMATGHYFGDTGDYSNTIYAGFPVPSAAGSVTPFIENDLVLGDLDQHFGDYLDEPSILKLARDKGYGTAALGKLGPTLIFDHTDRTGAPTIVFDDATGTEKGIPLAPEVVDRLTAMGLPTATPPRGDNGKAGSATTPGTHSANVTQQDYFAAAATRVVLPMLAERKQPFLMVYWSRDPDGSQHNTGDSLNHLVPGISGPTSLAGIRNADDNLGRLRAAVAELGLADTTDIMVTADHGFSTISKQSATSPAAKASYADVPAGFLPPGFVGIDLGAALGLPLHDPDDQGAVIAPGTHGKFANALLGDDPAHPKVVVATNGGSDLIYLPDGDKALAARVVDALLVQDYTSGVFVDSRLGPIPGALPLSEIGLEGASVLPQPAIAVSFRSFDTVCGDPMRCGVEVADTSLQQGQGMHGSFSRSDTWNFMAATGPDFRSGFVDPAPSSNADVGRTIAHLLDLEPQDKGRLVGRVLSEALHGGTVPLVTRRVVASAPGRDRLATVLNEQLVGGTRYFDSAGFVGRTLGLTPPAPELANGL
ncbi:MAG: alkaline phosphatase family protein [Geminicoccaceae bacterium]